MKQYKYRIPIDGNWTLEDLYEFPRAYEQVFFFFYSLSDEELIYRDEENPFGTFPWQGGYSAVNFYNRLKYQVPPRKRPVLSSIHKASPGWIELAVNAAVFAGIFISVAKSIKCVCSSIDNINNTYSSICKGLNERKMMRIKTEQEKIKLEMEHIKFLENSTKSLMKILGLKDISKLERCTDGPYVRLKILLSLYRRVRALSEYDIQNKASFPVEKP